MAMATLTLSSDLHPSSPQLALVKHLLHKGSERSLHIVDLVHTQHQFNLIETSLFLRYHSSIFGEGSVHLLLGDMYENFEGYFVMGLANGHLFIAPNNGVLSLIHPSRAWVWLKKISLAETHYLSIIESIAEYATKPEKHTELAELPREKWRQHEFPLPTITQSSLRGNFIWVDGFGNVMSNIDRSVFEEKKKHFARYQISFGHAHDPIRQISSHYGQVAHGDELAMFNSMQLLEIAVSHGNASRLLGLRSVYDKQLDRHHYHTSIQIDFEG